MRVARAASGLVGLSLVWAAAARAQAPEAPTDLEIMDFSATDVMMQWIDNNSTSHPHRVYRSVDGGAFVAVHDTPWGGGGYPTNHLDFDVTGGTTYTYYVVAFDPISTTVESAESNHVTVTAGTPYLDVTDPDGAESLTAGVVHTVTWDTNWPALNVGIRASTDGGLAWDHVVRDGTQPLDTPGSFAWKVGYDKDNVPFITQQSDNCVIEVKSVDGSLVDESAAPFTILPEPAGNGGGGGDCAAGGGAAAWVLALAGLALAGLALARCRTPGQ